MALTEATKNSSFGTKPHIIVACDFNRANTSFLTTTLYLYKINIGATHKKGGVLDIIFTNAPKCYTAKVWNSIGKSDHKIVVALPMQVDYQQQLPAPRLKFVRSGNICDTVAYLRSADWTPILSSTLTLPQDTADEFNRFL